MNTDITQFIPEDFDSSSRIWIYQSSRLFSMPEAFELETMFEQFLKGWNTHGTPVKGYVNLLFGQFIVLMADESATHVSGCSTDSSVRLIKEVEQKFDVSMFNRQMMAFIIKDKIQLLPMEQIPYAIENNFITPDTLYFNNLVATKAELLRKWITPVKDSWLAKKFLKPSF
jgi:hypothetical protein